MAVDGVPVRATRAGAAEPDVSRSGTIASAAAAQTSLRPARPPPAASHVTAARRKCFSRRGLLYTNDTAPAYALAKATAAAAEEEIAAATVQAVLQLHHEQIAALQLQSTGFSQHLDAAHAHVHDFTYKMQSDRRELGHSMCIAWHVQSMCMACASHVH